MTTQDIQFWVQTSLQLLVGGGVVWGVVWLGGVLKRAIEGQEKTIAALKTTIEAQAEQMKAHSMMVQDVERLHKMIQQVLDIVNPEAQLRREQARMALLDRDAAAMMEQQAQQLNQRQKETLEHIAELVGGTSRDLIYFIREAMMFIPHGERMRLIEETALSDRSRASKDILTKLAQGLPYQATTDVASLPAARVSLARIGQSMKDDLPQPRGGRSTP
jgi:hypothetical protein